MVGAVLREGALMPGDQMGAAATEDREHGLLSAGPADPGTIARAYQAQTGHALPASASRALASAAESDTARRAAASGLAPVASPTTAPPMSPAAATPARSAVTTGPSGGSHRLYIGARDARALAAPLLFGTFLETYARRHGWLGTMPLVTRVRWRIAGIISAGVGIAVLSAGVSAYSDPATGFGLGLLFGGLVAFWLAPAMVQPSAEGGRVSAQLAAYRRTLQMTFLSASSMDDAVGPAGLAWLSTPDQAVAWAVALGLAPDVGALLARSAPGDDGTSAEEPAWYRSAPHGSGATATGPSVAEHSSPAAMFAGILAIGSSGPVGPGWFRPFRGWWPG